MQWGWSQPGRAPGTAGGHHTQTGFLAGPVLGHGPPKGPAWGATGAPGGLGGEQEEEGTGQNGKASAGSLRGSAGSGGVESKVCV